MCVKVSGFAVPRFISHCMPEKVRNETNKLDVYNHMQLERKRCIPADSFDLYVCIWGGERLYPYSDISCCS